jgi:membrane protein implicated in regulation of membrane protease activity
MDNIAWILWLVLAVGLMIAEIFTLGFVLFWFGIGALAAALAGFLGLGIGWQFAAFAVVSIVLTAMSRTIFSRYLPHNEGSAMRSGIESMPGKIGTVSAGSTGALNEGAVKVFGSTWTAFPVDGEGKLVEGEKVEVVEVKGSSIYVRRVTNELPEWRHD